MSFLSTIDDVVCIVNKMITIRMPICIINKQKCLIVLSHTSCLFSVGKFTLNTQHNCHLTNYSKYIMGRMLNVKLDISGCVCVCVCVCVYLVFFWRGVTC